MITLLGPLLLLGLYVALVAGLAARHRGLALWGRAAVIPATVRVGVFWGLLALHWRGTLGLWATPFLLLLLPEGFLLPRHFIWTLPRALLVSGLLVVGTALCTAMAMGLGWILRWRGARGDGISVT